MGIFRASLSDSFYIFTDGFPDQFGGPQGRKFMYKSFRNLLFENRNLSMDEQRDILDKSIEDWRGDSKQIDDILIIAVADCTGHGVPGALVSMLGAAILNEISFESTAYYSPQ